VQQQPRFRRAGQAGGFTPGEHKTIDQHSSRLVTAAVFRSRF
jgi:hypothetical protein